MKKRKKGKKPRKTKRTKKIKKPKKRKKTKKTKRRKKVTRAKKMKKVRRPKKRKRPKKVKKPKKIAKAKRVKKPKKAKKVVKAKRVEKAKIAEKPKKVEEVPVIEKVEIAEKPGIKVPYTQENAIQCMCSTCPVQAESMCAKEKMEKIQTMIQAGIMPPAEDLPGLYCSSGFAACKDLDFTKMCMCGDCPLWAQCNLASGKPMGYFCRDGKAE